MNLIYLLHLSETFLPSDALTTDVLFCEHNASREGEKKYDCEDKAQEEWENERGKQGSVP